MFFVILGWWFVHLILCYKMPACIQIVFSECSGLFRHVCFRDFHNQYFRMTNHSSDIGWNGGWDCMRRWGLVKHICFGTLGQVMGLGNGLSPAWCQIINWTSDDLVDHCKKRNLSSKEIRLSMSSEESLPFCSSLNRICYITCANPILRCGILRQTKSVS